MLALAIISTVILVLLIMVLFGAVVTDYDGFIPFLIILFLLGFVIMTIWILYAR